MDGGLIKKALFWGFYEVGREGGKVGGKCEYLHVRYLYIYNLA